MSDFIAPLKSSYTPYASGSSRNTQLARSRPPISRDKYVEGCIPCFSLLTNNLELEFLGGSSDQSDGAEIRQLVFE